MLSYFGGGVEVVELPVVPVLLVLLVPLLVLLWCLAFGVVVVVELPLVPVSAAMAITGAADSVAAMMARTATLNFMWNDPSAWMV
jgi:hypothetical protein